MKTLFSLIVISCLLCCDSDSKFPLLSREDYLKRVTIDEGVWGTLEFWEGDFMPSIPHHSGNRYAVEREVLIYEAVYWNTAKRVEASFYDSIPTPLVTTVNSDHQGFFQAKLSPGTYSIFVRENGLLYQNLTSGSGYIGEVVVQSQAVTEYDFDITYKATF